MARRQKARLPTAEDILDLFRQAENYWKPLHDQMEIDNQIFNLALPVTAPDGYNVIYPGTGNSIVMTAADHIAGDAPQVKVPEAGLSKRAQERSEDLEQALQASLYRFQADQVENTYRTLVVNALWSGMMVSQGPIFDPTAWGLEPIESEPSTYDGYDAYATAKDDYDTTKRVRWPFIWRAVDPRYVFPDPGTCGKKWVIVKYDRIAGEIKAQWPEWDMRLADDKSGKPLPADQKVTWMEFWSETHRVYMAGNKILDKVREHRYGKPTFQIRSAGYGNDSGIPEERFRSILWAARSLIKAEIGAFSHRDALIRKTAWTQMLAPIGSTLKSMEPGTVVYDTPENIEAIKAISEIQPLAIQAVSMEIDQLDAEIQKATFPNVVQGIRAKGIASGYGQNSLVAQARVKYGAVVINLQSLLAEFLVDLARCVQHVVGESVPVWGHTKWGNLDSVLKLEDVDGLQYVVVDVNPKLPADRANEIEAGGVLLDRGVIDTDFYLSEYVGVEQPGKMRERVLRDRALQDPAIIRVLALAAALKGGYIDYVMQQAQAIGMDPGQMLSVLGFGNPSQMAPAQNQGAGAPQNVAAQRQGGQATMFGGALKAQPVPGSPSDVRDQAVPGVPIG